MAASSPVQLDIRHDTAVITIGAPPGQAEIVSLLDRCRSLPPAVVTLQVDLTPLGSLGDTGGTLVRLILHVWRKTRGGSFRLTTEHLVASCQQVVAVPAPVWSAVG